MQAICFAAYWGGAGLVAVMVVLAVVRSRQCSRRTSAVRAASIACLVVLCAAAPYLQVARLTRMHVRDARTLLMSVDSTVAPADPRDYASIRVFAWGPSVRRLYIVYRANRRGDAVSAILTAYAPFQTGMNVLYSPVHSVDGNADHCTFPPYLD